MRFFWSHPKPQQTPSCTPPSPFLFPVPPRTGLCAGTPSPPVFALLRASGEQAALGPTGGRLRLGPIEMENPYKEPPKKCVLCGIKVDYKNVQLLSQFVSPYTGRIYGRHLTGLCNKKQKEISKTIKRAQVLGFMPVMFKNTSFLTDPKICNVKY
uniref:Small ribosomal subunit protein bS18m n=1 Tax=Anser brachyrhynchus TaxID=132585 RepID=A0A8B9CD51_9AVES